MYIMKRHVRTYSICMYICIYIYSIDNVNLRNLQIDQNKREFSYSTKNVNGSIYIYIIIYYTNQIMIQLLIFLKSRREKPLFGPGTVIVLFLRSIFHQ